MPYDDLIEKHANRVGIPAGWLKRFVKIESGGDPSNRTGSYHGLLQLSKQEFKAGGGTGDIYDPEQNLMAGANKLARESLAFKQKHGRDPSMNDLYMIHQQGEAGYGAHLANPEGAAWQNVRRYYGSDAVAKKAIWGNIPDADKKKFDSVENVSSQDFTNLWASKTEGTTYESVGPFKVAKKAKAGEEPETEVSSRGLGREEEPKPKGFDFEAPSIPQMPDIRIPTMMGAAPPPAARGPKIPGATRWEQL